MHYQQIVIRSKRKLGPLECKVHSDDLMFVLELDSRYDLQSFYDFKIPRPPNIYTNFSVKNFGNDYTKTSNLHSVIATFAVSSTVCHNC